MAIDTGTAIYFYGPHDANFGFLSNFFMSEFIDHENTYNWSEQYFMKQKQELFDPTNEKMATAILDAKTPFIVKRLGRRVQHFDESVWNAKRYDYMLKALKLKFSANTKMRNALLSTGDKKLYEASRMDRSWGIGMNIAQVAKLFRDNEQFIKSGDIDKETQQSRYGNNLLGKALMECRSWLNE